MSEANGMKLPPWTDDALHPSVQEALKVWDASQGEVTRTKRNINGQYLKALDGQSGDSPAQANAVRALMGGVPEE